MFNWLKTWRRKRQQQSLKGRYLKQLAIDNIRITEIEEELRQFEFESPAHKTTTENKMLLDSLVRRHYP